MALEMDMEPYILPMGTNMKDILNMTNSMGKVLIIGLMEINMRDNLRMT